jgi:hypothetical protein
VKHNVDHRIDAERLQCLEDPFKEVVLYAAKAEGIGGYGEVYKGILLLHESDGKKALPGGTVAAKKVKSEVTTFLRKAVEDKVGSF